MTEEEQIKHEAGIQTYYATSSINWLIDHGRSDELCELAEMIGSQGIKKEMAKESEVERC